MARWTAGAKWGEAPAPDSQCATPLALSLSEWLGLARRAPFDPTQTLWWYVIQFSENLWYLWLKMLDSVAHRFYDKDGNWQSSEILLKLNVLIHCQEDIKLRGRQRKELSVLDA